MNQRQMLKDNQEKQSTTLPVVLLHFVHYSDKEDQVQNICSTKHISTR